MATFFSQRAPCMRCVASATRTFVTPVPVKATFSVQAAPQTSSLSRSIHIPSPTLALARASISRSTQFRPLVRHASGGAITPPQANSKSADILTWDRFFDLRRKRRWINLGASVATAAVSVGVIAPALAEYDVDTWGAQTFGLDPIIVLGISTFAVAAGGWLCGPAFGNTGFSFWVGRKGWSKLIAEKEKTFYARIKRYRADPSASSPQNPIPDYYGEKIGSVKDYRRWLKDQRAFNLKKNKNMI